MSADIPIAKEEPTADFVVKKEFAKGNTNEGQTPGVAVGINQPEHAKESPRLRIIFYQDFTKTRAISINIPNQNLKFDVKMFLEEFHDTPIKAQNAKKMEEGLDGDKLFYEFDTIDYYREFVLYMEKKYTIVYVDPKYKNFVHPPNTLRTAWDVEVPFGLTAEQIAARVYPNPNLDTHQNQILKKCISTAMGRCLLKGRLLFSKKVLALMAVHSFRFESNNPIVIVTKHGRVTDWYDTLHTWGTKGAILNLSSKSDFNGGKQYDYILCTETQMDRLSRLPEAANIKYYIFDEVLYNKVISKKIFGIVKNFERCVVIMRSYDELDEGIKRMIFGMFLRPDFANRSEYCKPYPCLQSSHVFGIDPSMIFTAEKKYEFEQLLRIVPVHSDLLTKTEEIELIFEKKDKQLLESCYKKSFSDKKQKLKEDLQSKYLKGAGEAAKLVALRKYDEEVAGNEELEKNNVNKLKEVSPITDDEGIRHQIFKIKNLGSYIENHVHESMIKALRFHLFHNLEESKVTNILEDLDNHRDLANKRKILVFGYNALAMTILRKKLEKTHSSWRVLEFNSRSDLGEVRGYFTDEIKTIMTCSVTASKKKLRGLKFDTIILSDINYTLESIRDIVALTKINPNPTNKLIVYYSTNNPSELSVWDKHQTSFELGIKLKFEVAGNYKNIQPLDVKGSKQLCCSLGEPGMIPFYSRSKESTRNLDSKTESEMKRGFERGEKKSQLVEEQPETIKILANPGPTGSKGLTAFGSPVSVGSRSRSIINFDEVIRKSTNDHLSFKRSNSAVRSPGGPGEEVPKDSELATIYANLSGLLDQDCDAEGKSMRDDHLSTKNITPDKDDIPEEIEKFARRLLDESLQKPHGHVKLN